MREMHKKQIILFIMFTVLCVAIYYYTGYLSGKQLPSDHKDMKEFQKELPRQHGMPVANPPKQQSDRNVKNLSNEEVHLSLVCCGDRLEEAMNMLKSAVMFTKATLRFHIFAEDQLQEEMARQLNSWPIAFRRKFSFSTYPIAFPSGKENKEWKELYAACSSQRLFMPDLLKNLDSVLYVDTDLLFFRPVENIWNLFKEFNKMQYMGIAECHELTSVGWYHRFAKHPYYGLNGLNSGVILMNLSRIRTFNFTDRVIRIYREYKTKIVMGDQDLLNIFFYFQPEGLYVIPCEWNFRPGHCQFGLNCHRINDYGVPIVHGCGMIFHNNDELPFKAIYDAFNSYKLGSDIEKPLITGIQRRLSETKLKSMNCTKALWTPIIKTIRKSYSEVNSKIENT